MILLIGLVAMLQSDPYGDFEGCLARAAETGHQEGWSRTDYAAQTRSLCANEEALLRRALAADGAGGQAQQEEVNRIRAEALANY
jgi:hypothetical protein